MVDVPAVGEPLADVQDGRYETAPGNHAEMVTFPESPGGLTRRRAYGAGQRALPSAGLSSAATIA
jgi:hypothetical protein